MFWNSYHLFPYSVLGLVNSAGNPMFSDLIGGFMILICNIYICLSPPSQSQFCLMICLLCYSVFPVYSCLFFPSSEFSWRLLILVSMPSWIHCLVLSSFLLFIHLLSEIFICHFISLRNCMVGCWLFMIMWRNH